MSFEDVLNSWFDEPEKEEKEETKTGYKQLLTDSLNGRIAQLLNQGYSKWEIARECNITLDLVDKRRSLLRRKAVEEFQEVLKAVPKSVTHNRVTKDTSNVKELEKRMIFDFHLYNIRLNKTLDTTMGKFKRHSRGGVLDQKAIKLLPLDKQLVLEKVLREKGVELVHLNERVLTVPKEMIKITK